MGIEKVTPGSRLKDLIERQAYKMKEFADVSGIYYTTLSRYVHDKVPMPDRYVFKVARILNVTPEYIKCQSDDPTPPQYQVWNSGSDEKNESVQQFRFKSMVEFLKGLGVAFLWKLQIEEVIYIMDSRGIWLPIEGEASIHDDGLDQIEFLEEIQKVPEKSRVWVEVTYKDRKKVYEYAEFHQLLRYLVASMELSIQREFNFFRDIPMSVIDTDVDRALRGEFRINHDEE